MKKTPLLLFISGLVLFQVIFLISIPTIPAKAGNPPDFSSDLRLRKLYVYNVTDFGGDLNWLGLDWMSKYNVSSNPGGQIILNVTDFYDKDPNDIFNAFGSPMAYMDVEFIENNMGVLESNHTFMNVSNGEAAFNMLLGYNTFQSGFVIPTSNFTYLKELALTQDSGYFEGDITVEETYSFISFDFKQETGAQNTTLKYDKKTGLLIWVRTEMTPIVNPLGYTLEMQLTNYSFDFNTLYTYNVSKFGDVAFWYDWNFNYVDTWTTNPGGLVQINFTGLFPKDPAEPGWSTDAFPSNLKRAWLDLEVFYDGYFGPIGPQISLANISNREAAIQMGIGYGDFQTGYMVPMIDNLTFIRNSAVNAAQPGEVTFEETDLTIFVKYDQIGGFEQKTHLIYEKITGLLLWVDSDVGSYSLEMKLIGFEFPETPPTQPPPAPPPPLIDAFPIGALLITLLISVSVIIIGVKKRTRRN